MIECKVGRAIILSLFLYVNCRMTEITVLSFICDDFANR